MTSLSLYTKLEALPSALKKEANDFIEYLVSKTTNKKKLGNKKPKFGSLKGKIFLSDDFDAALDMRP
jgi:hypothetical protein